MKGRALAEWAAILLWCVVGAATTCAAQAVVSSGARNDKAPSTVTSRATATPQVNDNYTIGVEDELQISVWKEPDFSAAVVVRPDGMITLPGLNDVYVVGLTTKQLQNQLTEQLKPFVSEPQVTVIVRAIRSRKVYLAGKVAHPGAYILNGDKTVLQMLLEAGGLTQFAKTSAIYVLRKTGSGEQHLAFNYKKALKGEAKSDFALNPGDMVVVP